MGLHVEFGLELLLHFPLCSEHLVLHNMHLYTLAKQGKG